MNAIEALVVIAQGERVADALLPPCRLEGMGVEAYGEEAIVHHFRRHPLAGWEPALSVRSNYHAALFGDGIALVADLHADRIARIWRLSGGEPGEAEPMIGVAFDTDMIQSRSDVAMRAEDHPELDSALVDSVRRIGERIAHGWSTNEGKPFYRTRPFLLRGFSRNGAGAALFAVHRLGPASQRSAGFAFAAAHLTNGGSGTLVRDIAGENAIEQRGWRSNFA